MFSIQSTTVPQCPAKVFSESKIPNAPIFNLLSQHLNAFVYTGLNDVSRAYKFPQNDQFLPGWLSWVSSGIVFLAGQIYSIKGSHQSQCVNISMNSKLQSSNQTIELPPRENSHFSGCPPPSGRQQDKPHFFSRFKCGNYATKQGNVHTCAT